MQHKASAWLFLFITILCILPSNSLKCYECSCTLSDLSGCRCNDFSDFDDGSYCFIDAIRSSNDTLFEMTRLPLDSTYIPLKDTYYILVIESIRYNQTSATWSTVPTGAAFGCDWDLCNSFNYVDTLPYTFQLGIDTNWLTTNIYGTGVVDSCRTCATDTCGNATNPIDDTKCPILPCNKTTTVRSSTLSLDFDENLATSLVCCI